MPTAWVEIALFLAATVAIDLWFQDGTRFWAISPHPFWAIVLLTAVQYGTNAAMAAAVAATVTLLTGELPAQTFDQNRFEYLFMLAKLPVLWLLSAVALGELALRHRRQRDDAIEIAQSERGRADDLSEAYDTARSALDRIEEYVAAEATSTARVLTLAANKDKQLPGRALECALEMVGALVSPRKFSLSFLDDGVLRVGLQEGWAVEDSWPLAVGPDDPLFQAIVGERRRVVASHAADEAILAGRGVIAVPVVAGSENPVRGMLRIEDAALTAMTFARIELVDALGAWIGAALLDAERLARAQANAIAMNDLAVCSPAFLRRQETVMRALASRGRFSLSELHISLPGPYTRDQRERVAHAIAEATQAVLRPTDQVFSQNQTGDRLVILLPLSDATDAGTVSARLQAAAAVRLDDPQLAEQLSYTVAETMAAPQKLAVR